MSEVGKETCEGFLLVAAICSFVSHGNKYMVIALIFKKKKMHRKSNNLDASAKHYILSLLKYICYTFNS